MTLRLNGSTSGYVEIDAPAVAGSTTITLPATTGGSFVVSDSSGNIDLDNGTLYVDATNNRIGIGTTSPGDYGANVQLAVGNPSGIGSVSILAGTSSNGSLYFADGTSGTATYSGFLQYRHATDSLAIGTAASDRVIIDSSGRLLVGTSSTSANTSALFQGIGGSPTGAAQLRVALGSTAPGTNDALGYLIFSDSGHSNAAWLAAHRDGGTWTSGSSQPTRLVFSTTADGASSPTERMRIDNSGTVSINGTKNFDTYFYLQGDTNKTGTLRINYTENAATSRKIQHFYRANTEVGSIAITNAATAYNTSSDYRLKENVVTVTDGITRLKQLKPARFNFIIDPDRTVDGFIAHEVQDIVPEAITGEKDAVDDEGNPKYQGIDQSKLVPLLTAALQEAIGEIESLKARVAALESA